MHCCKTKPHKSKFYVLLYKQVGILGISLDLWIESYSTFGLFIGKRMQLILVFMSYVATMGSPFEVVDMVHGNICIIYVDTYLASYRILNISNCNYIFVVSFDLKYQSDSVI